MFCVLNGAVTPLAEAKVAVTDRGFLYGETLFETMRAGRGQVALWERHAARLEATAGQLGFALPYGRDELRAQCAALLAANDRRDGVIRLTVSRGQSERGLDPAGAHDPAVVLTLGGVPPGLAEKARAGYRVARSSWCKPGPRSWPLFAKTGNYLHSVLARQSVGAGFDEALVFDEDGCLAEGSFSNVFVVRGGALLTPALPRCLPGVARALVLELARADGMEVRETSVDESDLDDAEEIFLTNAVRGPMPVVESCGRLLGPGALTARLSAAWGERTGWPEFDVAAV